MKKELSPIHDLVSCEICERTILKGERTEAYLATDGSRRLVCELCLRRAERAGWIRESAHADLPATLPRSEPRPSLIDRFRRWRAENGQGHAAPPEAEAPGYEEAPGDAEPEYVEPAAHAESPAEAARPAAPDAAQGAGGSREAAAPEQGAEGVPEADYQEVGAASVEAEKPPEHADEAPEADAYDYYGDYAESSQPARLREAGGPRDPRHVRAVPTNSQAKVERALEIFNATENRRTVAGLLRTLGEPWVTAVPVVESPSEVTVVVAWELSWYHYRVDLADAGEPVHLFEKGSEVHEIDEELRDWNASAGPDGSLVPGVASGQ